MITLRWVCMVLAVITLWCLRITPISPASALLAGFLLILFVAVCWTCGAFERNHDAEH